MCFLVIAVIVGTVSLFAIEKSCDTMIDVLYEINCATETENAELVNALTVKLDDEWKNKKILFHILIDHNEMDGIETGIEKATYYAKEQDFYQCRIISEDCLASFNHIKESAEPSLSNIF